MLQNAYFLAKIGADTAENEQHFAEILLTEEGVQLVMEQVSQIEGITKVWPADIKISCRRYFDLPGSGDEQMQEHNLRRLVRLHCRPRLYRSRHPKADTHFAAFFRHLQVFSTSARLQILNFGKIKHLLAYIFSEIE